MQDFNNEPFTLTYIKDFTITPIYNTLFPNILPEDDDDFDYSDMPELIPVSDSNLNLDVATESVTESVPSLNLNVATESVTESVPSLNLDEIKRNIESTASFSSANEGLNALNNPDQLMNCIQGAFDSFKSQVGRNMTYSEMRQMMG
jgi:hypothetical protein